MTKRLLILSAAGLFSLAACGTDAPDTEDRGASTIDPCSSCRTNLGVDDRPDAGADT